MIMAERSIMCDVWRVRYARYVKWFFTEKKTAEDDHRNSPCVITLTSVPCAAH